MSTEIAVKDRPILFSAPMVRAILAGRKTQTRRVVKPPVPIRSPCDIRWMDESPHPEVYAAGGAWIPLACPYGATGTRLWVRETWSMASTACGGEETIYAADYPDDSDKASGVVRRPSIHMRRDQSRITLEITDVRVQRLQEISEVDACDEGFDQERAFGVVLQTRVEMFRKLWNDINEKRGFGWDANPWVWVITFRRLPKC